MHPDRMHLLRILIVLFEHGLLMAENLAGDSGQHLDTRNTRCNTRGWFGGSARQSETRKCQLFPGCQPARARKWTRSSRLHGTEVRLG